VCYITLGLAAAGVYGEGTRARVFPSIHAPAGPITLFSAAKVVLFSVSSSFALLNINLCVQFSRVRIAAQTATGAIVDQMAVVGA
jgi:hypothetical protein